MDPLAKAAIRVVLSICTCFVSFSLVMSALFYLLYAFNLLHPVIKKLSFAFMVSSELLFLQAIVIWVYFYY